MLQSTQNATVCYIIHVNNYIWGEGQSMNYLLTNPQKSIWLTEKVYSGTSINNISGYTYINEDIKFDVLKKAINEVIPTL